MKPNFTINEPFNKNNAALTTHLPFAAVKIPV